MEILVRHPVQCDRNPSRDSSPSSGGENLLQSYANAAAGDESDESAGSSFQIVGHHHVQLKQCKLQLRAPYSTEADRIP